MAVLMNKRRIAGIAISICLIIFFCLLFRVIAGENQSPPVYSDAIVILGHSLEDGNSPGEWLTARLSKGLELYSSGYAEFIIVSGGEGPTDDIPVSHSMKNWLMENGVNGDNIITEDKASNTYENFLFVKDITEAEGIESIIVVTSDFHIYRSYIIGKSFYGNISMCPSPSEMGLGKVLAYIKEPLSIIKYYILGVAK